MFIIWIKLFYFQLCPEEEEKIGYRKVDADNGMFAIVKLLIPAEARRNSATTYRCRADKAKIIQIEREENVLINMAGFYAYNIVKKLTGWQ